jgi:ankyrin repeat protein
LHHAVLKGIENKVEFLISVAGDRNNNDWINDETYDEKLTPLHLASLRANLDAIYSLIRNGANIYSTNIHGLNVLHSAAQGNSVPPMYLFLMLGLNINSRDIRGGTPLHWATLCQSEQVLFLLLAKNADTNMKDIDGQTALHIAVDNLKSYNSTKIIRALLIKGADTLIEDN